MLNRKSVLSLFFARPVERTRHNLIKARIVAERVPKRQHFELTVTDGAWELSDFGKLFAGEVVLASHAAIMAKYAFS
jgi:hypothetical protein